MNPEHLTLAKQELSTLLSEGLIEPTTSPWACEAFYVNKHAEQVQGKLRLVIIYRILIIFLQMINSLCQTRVLSFNIFQMQKYSQSLILKQDFGN